MTVSLKTKPPNLKPVAHPVSIEADFKDSEFESNGKWYGLCRKNSIRSIEDFRKTVAQDLVLKSHYANFQWEKARLEKLDKPLTAYVYFRKEDQIFRKATPIILPAGDQYILDGTRRVRTHCCNDFVESPPLLESKNLETPKDEIPVPLVASNSESYPAPSPLGSMSTLQPGAISQSHFGSEGGNVLGVSAMGTPPPISGQNTSNGGSGQGVPQTLITQNSFNPDSPQGSLPETPDGPGPHHPPEIPQIPDDPHDPVTPVPEPSMIPMVGVGIVILFVAVMLKNHLSENKKEKKSTIS